MHYCFQRSCLFHYSVFYIFLSPLTIHVLVVQTMAPVARPQFILDCQNVILISLCQIEGKPPLGQDKAFSTEKR